MNWKDRFLVWLWKKLQRHAPVWDWTDYGNHAMGCAVCTQDVAVCEEGRHLWRTKERVR